VAGSAFHEKKDHPFRGAGQVRHPGFERVDRAARVAERAAVAEDRGQRERPEAGAAPLEEIAAVGQQLVMRDDPAHGR
jgi:hypothetical protein